MKKEQTLLSPKETAAKLGYSYVYFRDRISKKKGFPKKVGRNYYWPDVVRWSQEKAA